MVIRDFMLRKDTTCDLRLARDREAGLRAPTACGLQGLGSSPWVVRRSSARRRPFRAQVASRKSIVRPIAGPTAKWYDDNPLTFRSVNPARRSPCLGGRSLEGPSRASAIA